MNLLGFYSHIVSFLQTPDPVRLKIFSLPLQGWFPLILSLPYYTLFVVFCVYTVLCWFFSRSPSFINFTKVYKTTKLILQTFISYITPFHLHLTHRKGSWQTYLTLLFWEFYSTIHTSPTSRTSSP